MGLYVYERMFGYLLMQFGKKDLQALQFRVQGSHHAALAVLIIYEICSIMIHYKIFVIFEIDIHRNLLYMFKNMPGVTNILYQGSSI